VEKNAILTNNPYGFTGEMHDIEGRLLYLRARYYSPEMMRFIQQDTVFGEIENPLSLNLYIYCYDNPIKFTDPTGHKAGDRFRSLDGAAIDFGLYYNGESISKGKEMISFIFIYVEDGIAYYEYMDPHKKNPNVIERPDSAIAPDIPEGMIVVAQIHTHGEYDPKIGVGNDIFSDFKTAYTQGDIQNINDFGIIGYVVTPKGELLKYDSITHVQTTISINMPYDTYHPYWKKWRKRRVANRASGGE